MDPAINATTFWPYTSVILQPTLTDTAPEWVLKHDTAEVLQMADVTGPVMLIGIDRISSSSY